MPDNQANAPAFGMEPDRVLPSGYALEGTRAGGRRSWTRRITVAVFSLVLMLGVMVAGLIAVLSRGPVDLDFLSERIAVALEQRLGSGIDVSVGRTVLEKHSNGLELHIRDVVLKDPDKREILRSPDAIVTFDSLQLAGLRLAPKALALKGVRLTAIITAQNELILSNNTALSRIDEQAAGATVPAKEIAAFLMAMSQAGPGNGLESLALAEGSLRISDQRNGKTLAFDRIGLTIKTPRIGRLEASGSLIKDSDVIPLSVVAEMAGNEQTVRMHIDNIGDGILQALAGTSAPFVNLGTKLSHDVSARFDESWKLLSLDSTIKAGQGSITVPTLEAEPYLIDQFSARYVWTQASQKSGDLSVSFDGDGTHWNATGPLSSPTGPGQTWRWMAAGSNWRLKPLSPAEQPIIADRIEIALSVTPENRSAILEKMTLAGPGTRISLSGSSRIEADGPSLGLLLEAGQMPVRDVLRWWPSFIAPEARRFLVRTVKDGNLTRLDIKLAMAPVVLGKALRQEALPVDAFQIDGTVENVTAVLSPGMPPIAGLAGFGRIDSVVGQGTILRGFIDPRAGRRIQLSDGTFALNRLDTTSPDATFRFRSTAQLDAVAEFLRAPDLKGILSVDINPQNVKGQFDGTVMIALPLAASLTPSQIRTEVTGKMTGVTLEKAIGQDKLENATLDVTTDKTGVEIKGEGRWQGTPVTLSLENDAADRSLATVLSLTLDDAGLRRRGINFGSRLSGPLPIKIKTLQEDGEKWTAAVEVDLARATIDGLLPGFQKPAGRPGKLVFKATSRATGGFSLENLTLDSGASSFRGQVDVLADGLPQAARFSLFRLSPGDNVRLDFDRVGNGGKIVIRGNNLDARPFLRIANQAPASRGEPDKGDIDLDIRSTLVSGNGSEVLTGAEIRMLTRNGQLRQMAVNGKLNGKSVSMTGRSAGDAAPAVTIEADDAGAFLRFFDIYPRMQGGSLSGQVTPTGRRLSGYIITKDFVLRNEPAIRRLVTEAVPDQARQVASDTSFTKMRIDFVREGTETTIKESVIFGPQIGLTFNGVIDPSRDRISLSGTFIPAYGLNNAFAQIPVFGAILGGGRNEGLLAVTFGVSGKATNPNVTVNPLSAVAPGIFRKIFEFRNETTGTTPPLQ